MSRILKPAILLTKRFTYTQKFILIGTIYLLAIVLLFAVIFNTFQHRVTVLKKEKDGLLLISQILPLVQVAQKHRGLEAAQASKVYALQVEHDEADAALFRSMQTLQTSLPASITQEQVWQNALQTWKTIEQENNHNWSAERAYHIHTEFIQHLLLLIDQIVDNYGLTLDTDNDSYHVLDTLSHTMPDALEQLGQIRGLCLSILGQRQISDAHQRLLHEKIALLRDKIEKLNLDLSKVSYYMPALRANLDNTKQVLNLVSIHPTS